MEKKYGATDTDTLLVSNKFTEVNPIKVTSESLNCTMYTSQGVLGESSTLKNLLALFVILTPTITVTLNILTQVSLRYAAAHLLQFELSI